MEELDESEQATCHILSDRLGKSGEWLGESGLGWETLISGPNTLFKEHFKPPTEPPSLSLPTLKTLSLHWSALKFYLPFLGDLKLEGIK